MLHKNVTPVNVHVPYAWEFPTANARTSVDPATFTLADIGKLAHQQDNHSLWMLVGLTPLTWASSNSFVLETATVTRLGGVKEGANITIAPDGTISSPITSVNGQVGVVVLDQADVGLDQVDNTSDLDKPISTATQAALDLKADTAAVTAALATKADTAAVTAALATKANTVDLAVVALSGDHNDLINQPTIPTHLSQMVNDMGFTTTPPLGVGDNTIYRDILFFGLKLN